MSESEHSVEKRHTCESGVQKLLFLLNRVGNVQKVPLHEKKQKQTLQHFLHTTHIIA